MAGNIRGGNHIYVDNQHSVTQNNKTQLTRISNPIITID